MDWHAITELSAKLSVLKDFFFDVAANRERLSVIGLGGVRKLKGFDDAILALSSIESDLLDCHRTARFVDNETADRISIILKESPLVSQAANLKVSIQLAGIRKKSDTPLGFFREIVSSYSRVFGKTLFSGIFEDGGQIPIKRMLIDIDRLEPLVARLENIYFRRTYNDEEIFKPSNLDVEQVKLYLDNAIALVNQNTQISLPTKLNLETYFSDAKAELAKDTPAWKKIIGAMVIASTILGGLAVAPEALETVNSAIKYILGTSVESARPKSKEQPKFLPPPIEV